MHVVHVLQQFGGKKSGFTFFLLPIQSGMYEARSQRQETVFPRALISAPNQISSQVPSPTWERLPSLELWSFKFHVTSFLKAFSLMNKLHCQESVKILSSLIMQFLSINDIPPVPGETHPCTNRMWQLHHQQSLPRLQFSSEVNVSDRPFEKHRVQRSLKLVQCDQRGSPEDHPVPPVGARGGWEGGFIIFLPFQTKIHSWWKLWHSFHEVCFCFFCFLFFCLVGFFFGQGHMQCILVQRSWNPKAPFSEHPGLRTHTVTTSKAKENMFASRVFLVTLPSLNEWTNDWKLRFLTWTEIKFFQCWLQTYSFRKYLGWGKETSSEPERKREWSLP